MPEGLQRDLQAIEEAEDIVDEAIHIEVDSQYEYRTCAGPSLGEDEPPIQRAIVTGRGFSHRPMEVRRASGTYYSQNRQDSETWFTNTISFSYDDCLKEEQPEFKQMIFKRSKEE